jgi:type 1 glutamine amidotransferase
MRCMISLMSAALLLSVTPETSAQQAADDAKPHLVMVIAEGEYHTDQTLPPFAKANLGRDFRLTTLLADQEHPNHIPGIEALKTADVALLSIRRRTLPTDQLRMIQDHIEQGKPLVAIRTASHAFCLRDQLPEKGFEQWPDFDRQILGCHYRGHHGNSVQTFVRIVPEAAQHPVVQGITNAEFKVYGSLYQSLPLADSTSLLMIGRAEDIQPQEPVAWTNRTRYGGRVFYTSLGHPQDFTIPDFVTLLRNGIYWAAGRDVPPEAVRR